MFDPLIDILGAADLLNVLAAGKNTPKQPVKSPTKKNNSKKKGK